MPVSSHASVRNGLQEANDSQVELEDLSHLITCSEIITTKAASFAWSMQGPPVVQDLDFTIRRNEFTFIIGPVGSGKSSLLKGLLGEMPSSKGFVYTNNVNAGYVDQTPWIRNGSVRDNILGILNYEELWYGTVVRACALEQDIAAMPNGHNTQVGSAGISLSGGQKQRIALARAVYSRQSLLMLDDVFSGLDAQTEDHVFSKLMGAQGLLRKQGVSVLLVTHAVHRLVFADRVVALDVTGKVLEQGSYDTLIKSGGYVQNLAATAKAEHDKEEEDTEAPAAALAPVLLEMTNITHEVAELNRQTGEFAIYKYYFSSIGWRLVLIFAALAVVQGASDGLSQLIVSQWTAAVEYKGNQVNGFYLGIYGMLVTIALTSLIAAAW